MPSSEISIIISLFTLGFFGGFSHCAGMCGPFVLTQVGNRLSKIDINGATNFKKLSGIALLPYHLGRITTYTLIALCSSYLAVNLKNITDFKIVSGILLLIAAIILASTIFPFSLIQSSSSSRPHVLSRGKIQSGSIKFDTKWIPTFVGMTLGKIRMVIKKILNYLFSNPTGFKNYLLGISLGFIPCGLVYGAIITTAALDSYQDTLTGMIAFGIGTIPALFLTSCGGYLFFGKIKNYLKYFTKIILVINVITLLFISFGLIFNRI